MPQKKRTTSTASNRPGNTNNPKKLQDIHSQPSWVIRNSQVELAVTRLGAQMAPVTFYRDSPTPIQPYHISPWQGENLDLGYCPVLVPLRGDFFCLPFGGNGTPYKRESHPPHGETVGSPWWFAGVETKEGVTSLDLSIDTTVRKGRVRQRISIVEGENAVYTKTVIEGFKGKTTFAHHAILAMQEEAGVVNISTSPIQFGMTCPYPFGDPAAGEYQALAMGARFKDLARVPSIFKNRPDADCTSFPARRGFADLLQVFDRPARKNTPAWIAAVNTKTQSIWFALKDPAVMPGRVFWMENHGRHGTPWNGRNNCLGLESTSFANPAVTLARAASDTFAGVRPADVPGFVIAQLLGAAAATMTFRWLVPGERPAAATELP